MSQQSGTTTTQHYMTNPSETDAAIIDATYRRVNQFLRSNKEFLNDNSHANIAPKSECRVIGDMMYVGVTGVTKISSMSGLIGSLMKHFGNVKVDVHQKTDIGHSASNIDICVPLEQINNNNKKNPDDRTASRFWDGLDNPWTIFLLLMSVFVLLVAVSFVFDTTLDRKTEITDSISSWVVSWMPWNWGSYYPVNETPGKGKVAMFVSPEEAALLKKLKADKAKETGGTNPKNLNGAPEDARAIPRDKLAGPSRAA